MLQHKPASHALVVLGHYQNVIAAIIHAPSVFMQGNARHQVVMFSLEELRTVKS
jgi:hypothetical protein